MILEPKAKARLVKNILASLKDLNKITRPTALWLTANYSLKTNNWPIDSWRRPTKTNMEDFQRTFDLRNWIESDVDLDYTLGVINHGYVRAEDKNSYTLDLRLFRQRCEIVHELRRAVGLKEYVVRFTTVDWKNKISRQRIPIRALEEKDALIQWRKRWRVQVNHWDNKYTVTKIRPSNNYRAIYFVPRGIHPDVIKAVT
jgi:hypothetical protein